MGQIHLAYFQKRNTLPFGTNPFNVYATYIVVVCNKYISHISSKEIHCCFLQICLNNFQQINTFVVGTNSFDVFVTEKYIELLLVTNPFNVFPAEKYIVGWYKWSGCFPVSLARGGDSLWAETNTFPDVNWIKDKSEYCVKGEVRRNFFIGSKFLWALN